MIRELALALAIPGIAAADGFCDDLGALAKEGAPMLNMECNRSIALGGAVSHSCAQAFAYRSEAAQQTFAKMLEDVGTCATPIINRAPSVSHPDSYDLRQFETPRMIVSVSLKDKAALSKTYVFLRAESRNPS